MDSFRVEDVFTVQSASGLPFNIPGGVNGENLEQLPIQSHAQEAFQCNLGLGGRELYSKEQWEAQKPIIRQLYNLENTAVAEEAWKDEGCCTSLLLELQLSSPKNACTAELSAVVVAVANRLSPPRRR